MSYNLNQRRSSTVNGYFQPLSDPPAVPPNIAKESPDWVKIKHAEIYRDSPYKYMIAQKNQPEGDHK
ncbi:MAG: hypothetical protein QM537_00035 [Candidatus Symbiobacter sp.]|nr:hypothetical protein [Candidatus Symbiobacter sp.]